MKNIFLILPLIMVLAFSKVKADEVILYEGKTLSGTITNEDKDEVTINLGENMYLRVDRKKIKQINRTPKAAPPGKVVTAASLKPKVEKKPTPQLAPVQGSTGTVLPTTVTSSTIPVKNFEGEVKFHEEKLGEVTLKEVLVKKTYKVQGRTFEEVKANIFSVEEGKGFLEGKKRDASQTTVSSSWEGASKREGPAYSWKSIVVRSTITIQCPFWTTTKKTDAASVQKWGQFLSQLEKREANITKIYRQSLSAAGDALMAVQANTEPDLNDKSKQTYESLLARSEKQVKGLIRRSESSRPLVTKKKAQGS